MKKKLTVLCAMFLIIILGSVAVSRAGRSTNENRFDDQMNVVTSFYPMYILTLNIAKDVPKVSVVNLTENQTGCLHDYQLTTQDMVQLSQADLLILNGGGMEGFVENIVSSYPNLSVVETSKPIELLPSTSEHDHSHEEEAGTEEHDHHEEEVGTEEHDHSHEDEAGTEEHDHHEDEAGTEEHDHHEDETEAEEHGHHHDHGEYNAHVWMSFQNYFVQMEQVKDALVTADPEHKAIYVANYEEYKQKVEALQKRYKEQLKDYTQHEVVIFHDAFAYLAQELGLDVVVTVNMDSDTYLSAGEVKEIIDEVNRHQVKVLFTEEQYSDSIAESIAKETDAKVYVIDSLVTGENTLDSYLIGMEQNLIVLKEALYQSK